MYCLCTEIVMKHFEYGPLYTLVRVITIDYSKLCVYVKQMSTNNSKTSSNCIEYWPFHDSDSCLGTHAANFAFSCSSADETEEADLDPDVKAQREKERRQANNARERCAFVLLTADLVPCHVLCILAYIHYCVSNNTSVYNNIPCLWIYPFLCYLLQ